MNLIQFTLGSSRCQQDEQLIRIEAVNKIPLKAKTSSDLLVSFMLKPLSTDEILLEGTFQRSGFLFQLRPSRCFSNLKSRPNVDGFELPELPEPLTLFVMKR